MHVEPWVPEPELSALQPARLVLDYDECDNREHSAETGIARLVEGGVLWLADAEDRWQFWPFHAVLCLDFIPPATPERQTGRFGPAVPVGRVLRRCLRRSCAGGEVIELSARTGTTADGLSVTVDGWEHYPTARVFVDGVERIVLRASRLRDGGTTTFKCEDGTLVWPNRLGSDDRTPRWTTGGRPWLNAPALSSRPARTGATTS